MSDDLAAEVAALAWEESALERIQRLIADTIANVPEDAMPEQLRDRLRDGLRQELGDGSELRDEALFVLAAAHLSQDSARHKRGAHEQLFLAEVMRGLAGTLEARGIESVGELPAGDIERVVDEAASHHRLSKEVAREITRRELGRPG